MFYELLKLFIANVLSPGLCLTVLHVQSAAAKLQSPKQPCTGWPKKSKPLPLTHIFAKY